ncbi:MAG TPA: DUF3341 domain-containing protein [Candidatus Binataceae bacterium]|nr:DUF3341 domain-containing protein [Candidatus Binataceae bacterium]
MSVEVELVGSFAEEEECVRAVSALKRGGIAFRVFSPIPSEHLLHAIGKRLSPVRAFVLIGGIAGVLTGLAVTVGTSWEWNLVAGGKPVVSMPPFIIIMFELMVLFGGLSAALSFFFFAGLPSLDSIPGYSERFGADRFGIAVACSEADSSKIESLMREAGAEDVSHEDPLAHVLVSHFGGQ